MKKTGKLKHNILFVLMTVILSVCIPAMGRCFEITATVDNTRISRQDAIVLKLVVKGSQSAHPDLSGVQDFDVHPRGTASSFQFINGKSERKITYNYVLIPRSTGDLVIPSIRVEKDGQTKTTTPIHIQVSEQVKDPDQVRAIFAKASISPLNLVAGQQAVYTIQFFTSKPLAGLNFENPPEFKGLTAKAFESEKNYQSVINGQAFHVTQVDYLIVPSTAGSVVIDPVTFVAKVRVQSTAARDPFFDSFINDPFFSSTQYKPMRVVSNPVTFDVAKLPEYKGEKAFSGLVGKFSLDATLDRFELAAGESATLTIKISGTGNVRDAGVPEK